MALPTRKPAPVVLSVKLARDVDARLARLAARRGVTKSTAVRDLIEAALATEPRKRAASILERARHLVGSFEGPGDLTSDPKYWDDYGA